MNDVRLRPEFLRSMEDFDGEVGEGLKPGLKAMVRLRCSHINGDAYSVRMHSEELARLGAKPHLIAALGRPVKLMREDLVTEAQAAVLRFAEILTDPPRGLEVEAREEVRRHLSAKAVGALVEVIAITNAWNRVTRGTE
ncbi:carboxymuconolactone decarboxylase family protein [Demequina capsici]|uniref:Carboxymuconolactone decarboxylase family protein n=1 Tax=Demequina capsici TaxID=3075620 RepID=A0AA96FA83_9MICO|nr:MULTISPECIES: carboxymuconolactone decarboxylase family protein [unclassified Demequina]WNM23559.1 carboxymuconolactone decarboxylase family protein [Demequina sp. OYTSA14]WNM26424.1 carboxymuconolactone decarboxylase family protein [Demequina sp. PMTSA13]